MIPATTFAGRDVAVFGLGRSGTATCRALAAGGALVHAWDDSPPARAGAEAAGIRPSDLNAADWSRFAALVLAPGVPLTHPRPHWTVERARASDTEIIGDVEIFARERAASCPESPFVAITGTNGKSTTTALVSHVLATAGRDVQMGGNIGVAILDLQPPAPQRTYVVEMSSYQIDLTPTLHPTIAALLNISPDHLDRHGTLENYAAIKARLLDDAACTVVGIDDDISREIEARVRGRGTRHWPITAGPPSLGFGVEDGKVIKWATPTAAPEVIADIAGAITLRGRHNAQNAAAASAITSELGVPPAAIAGGLANFPGLVHRMEEVARAGAVIFINDSKATNADSAANALATFERDIYWIAGGLAKEGGIASLAGFFPRLAKAYLIGESAADFGATLAGHTVVEQCATLDIAVARAAADAARCSGPEPVVLLSPACASFDQFRSFEVRGDAFRGLVAALPGVAMRERSEP